MRSNIVSEASLSTRIGQWWGGVPFITSGVVVVCGIIYLICLLIGYDSYYEICFWPAEVTSRFQVYRIYTAVLFHGSVLHVMFNMLALVPIGSGLERIMGSVRYLHVTLLVATCSAVLHLLIAYLAAHNPLHPYPLFMNECTIGFSGIIFAMIVMETSLNGNQSRSVFGLFNVPGKWYAWILLILFQLLMPNVSFIGHLCGILTGFACPLTFIFLVRHCPFYIRFLFLTTKVALFYNPANEFVCRPLSIFSFCMLTDTYGLLNYLILGSSSYTAIESSAMLAFCVRHPRFIVGGGSGVSVAGALPSFSSTTISGAGFGSVWRRLHSWLPQREISADEPQQDSRFPGRGRTLASSQNQSAARFGSDSELQTRLLERNSQLEARSEMMPNSTRGTLTSNARPVQMDNFLPSDPTVTDQDHVQNHAEAIQNLVAMGFEKSKAEVALVAANGDLTLAVELLSSPER